MVNTCKEFHILPLNKGDPSVRDFRPFVRRINPGGADFFITIFISKHHLNPLRRGNMTNFIVF